MDRYTTILIVMGSAVLATGIAGIFILPILRRLKAEQTILDIGPSWHSTKKGTPTMGGIMFIIGIAVAIAVGAVLYTMYPNSAGTQEKPQNGIVHMLMPLALGIAFGIIGFVDDMCKVKRKKNEGLTPRQKLLFQVLISVAYLICMQLLDGEFTILFIPPFGNINLGYFYYPFAIFTMLATSNAVNFTDGIDGLLTSVTAIVGMGFLAVSALLGSFALEIASAALIGGCIGFMQWNLNPAKVFMGDTGSLFLSGVVLGLAFGSYMPILILTIGIVYVIEMLSVVIQMLYFKATKGKRLFKMTPIHHSFEMSGYSENKIVLLFCFVTLLGAALGVYSVFLFLK